MVHQHLYGDKLIMVHQHLYGDKLIMVHQHLYGDKLIMVHQHLYGDKLIMVLDVSSHLQCYVIGLCMWGMNRTRSAKDVVMLDAFAGVGEIHKMYSGELMDPCMQTNVKR